MYQNVIVEGVVGDPCGEDTGHGMYCGIRVVDRMQMAMHCTHSSHDERNYAQQE
jgi:hypothetical protein